MKKNKQKKPKNNAIHWGKILVFFIIFAILIFLLSSIIAFKKFSQPKQNEMAFLTLLQT